MRNALLSMALMALLWSGCGKMEPGNRLAQADAGAGQLVQAAGQGNPPAAGPAEAKRKIIYTADVVLVTESLDDFRDRLTSSLEQYQGFIAAQQMTGRSGSQRMGTWTARLPAEQFSKFLEQLARWGELERESIQSDDVTEEFVDVESRLKNKRVEEERLLNLLKTQTDGLENVLAVERALNEVREQIERMEGRQRYLADKVEPTTITITVREVKDYVPPQPATFGTQLARTFQQSLHHLLDAGRLSILAVVAIIPWLIPLVIVSLPIGWFYRRVPSRKRG
ncbi:MAG: DUF4349 domain-containing protein [Planctomycetaceae bacterium]